MSIAFDEGWKNIMIIDTTHLKKFFKFTEGLFMGVD